MNRVYIPVWVLTILAVLLSNPAVAQDSTPSATPVAHQPRDLAAMVLFPADLSALGLPGFGLSTSSLRDAATQVVQHVKRGETTTDERLDVFRDTGFRYRYVLAMRRPQVPVVETSPGVFQHDLRIWTSITEFATAEGAAVAFPILEDERGSPNARDVPGTHPIGDQSELTRHREVTIDQGTPYHALNLTFRVGNLIADVGIDDLTGAEPDVATAEALADALRRKIERVRMGETPGPGLSWRVLRLAPDPERIYREVGVDWYTRLHGEDPPWFGDLAEALQATATPVALPAATPTSTPVAAADFNWNPTDIYVYQMPLGTGDPEDMPLYRVRLRHFESVLAAAWDLDSRLTDARRPLEPGGHIIERTVDDVTLGDGGFAVWESDGEGGVVAERRYRIYTRVGSQLVSLELDKLPARAEAPVASMEALMSAQVVCLRRVGWCESLPVPPELVLAAPAVTPDSSPEAGAPTIREPDSVPTRPAATPLAATTPAGTPVGEPVGEPVALSACRDVWRSDPRLQTLQLLTDCATDHSIELQDGWTFDGQGHTIVAVDPDDGQLTGGVIVFTGASGVVRNLTIDGSWLTAPCLVDRGRTALAGIRFDGVSGEISGITVRNLQRLLPPAAAAEAPPGESVRESCGTGIAMLGEDAQAAIEQNVINNVGYTGILVERGKASISYNTIQGAADTGILALLGAQVQISPGNRISNGHVGIQLEGSGTSGLVAGTSIDAMSDVGISVIAGARAEVTRNTLTDAGNNGIAVEGDRATVADIHHNHITQATGLAIKVLGGNAAVRVNEITGTAQIGIAARDGARAVIVRNTVSGTPLVGILADTAAAAQVRANTVGGGHIGIGYTQRGTTGTVNGNMVTGTDLGIVVEEGATAKVTANQIAEAASLGVYATSTGTRATVSDNAISGPGRDGIGFANGAQGTVVGNTVQMVERTGIWAGRSGPVTLTDNSIAESGFGIATDVDDITITITSNTMIDIAEDGFDLAGGTYVLADNGIATCGRDGIFIRDGAQVQASNTRIDGCMTGIEVVGDGATLDATGLTIADASRWGLFASGNNSVIMRDSTIVGAGLAGAVGRNASQVGLERMTFRGHVTGIVGLDAGTAITARESTFADYQGDIIIIVNGVDADLSGNTIVGPGHEVQRSEGTSGILMTRGATGAVHDNQISGFIDANSDEISCGIEVADPIAVSVRGNTFPPPGNELNVCITTPQATPSAAATN